MLREVDKYLVGRGREIMWDGNTEPLLGSTIDSAEQKLGALNKGGGKGGGQFQEIENHRWIKQPNWLAKLQQTQGAVLRATEISSQKKSGHWVGGTRAWSVYCCAGERKKK